MSNKSSLKFAIIATFGLRLVLGLTIYVAWSYIRLTAEAVIPPEQTQSLYGKVSVYQKPPLDGLLTAWFRWDAVHYLNIAQFGYHVHSDGASVFYPLYPILTRLLAILLGENYLLSALLVISFSCVAYLAGFNFLTVERLGQRSLNGVVWLSSFIL